MIRVLHIITSLTAGGAEQALYELVRGMDRERCANAVIGLRGEGYGGERIRTLGVHVRALNLNPAIPDPIKLRRLTGWVRSEQPDLVQTWMYHADLLGGMVSRAAGIPRLVWGVHHADLSRRNNKLTTLLVARMNARLSHRLPDRIVSPSRFALDAHIRFGYAPGKMHYIPNGFDIERFQPNTAARAQMRRALGLAEEVPLIGMAARYHPLKDHVTFIQAAALLHSQVPAVHFLLCGRDIGWDNAALAGDIRAAGLADRFHLIGLRPDMPDIFNALDIGALSSLSEAFPSVVGEMMACGLPCVVTDAGDAGHIIGGAGEVVPVGDPAALANGWVRLLGMDEDSRKQLGVDARRRVMTTFSLECMVDRYLELYEGLLAG